MSDYETSSYCSGGLHGMCPGYYKMTHTCRCDCHRKGTSEPPPPPEKVDRVTAVNPLTLVFPVSQVG